MPRMLAVAAVAVGPAVEQVPVDKRYCLLPCLLLCLLPTTAYAQDMSMVYLGDIFGRVSTVLDPESPSPVLSHIFRVFNYGLLTIGSLVLSYLAIMTSVQTAREGSFMGQEWGPQAAWIPLRAILGVSLLLPLPDGYCGAQILVVKLLTYSINAANVMWGTVLDNYEAGNTLSTPSLLIGAEETAEEIHRIAMCGAFYGYALEDNNDGTMKVGPGTRPYCGTIGLNTIGAVGGGTDQTKTAQLQAEEKRIIRDIFTQVLSQARQEFSNPNNRAFRIAIPDSVPLRTEQVWFEKNSIVRTLIFIRAEYDAIRNDSRFQNASSAVQQVSAIGRDRGWFFAGSFYASLAQSTHTGQINRAFGVARAEHPHPTNPNGDDDEYFRFTDRYSKYREFMTLVSDTSIQQQSLGNLGYQSSSGMGFYQETFGSLFTRIGAEFMSSLTQGVQVGGRADPILSMSNLGTTIMLTIEMLWMAGMTIVMSIMFAACFMTMMSPACHPIVSGARLIMNLLNWFIVTTWSGLVLIGIYAPMIPFLTFFFGTVQWFILAIEAVTAAPIIALTLASPSGDTWGKAQASVLLFLNLMLRPTLMVLGFVLGSRLAVTFFEAFNFAFNSTLASQIGSMGMFGVVAIIVMYSLLCVALLKECFSLIHILPDRTIRWIGGQVEQSGQRSSQMLDGAEQGAKTGAEGASKLAQAGTMFANKLMDKADNYDSEGKGSSDGGLEATAGGDEGSGSEADKPDEDTDTTNAEDTADATADPTADKAKESGQDATAPKEKPKKEEKPSSILPKSSTPPSTPGGST